jgi:hypothetical protein
VDDPGLLRIKNEKGSLTLDLDGRRVNTSSLSTDQRKRLIEMLNIVRPWLEGQPASIPETPAAHPPAPMPPPLTSSPSTPVPAARPSATTPPAVAKEKSSKDERPAAPANSIVGQIDAILQERLIGTPLEDSGLFLAQSPEGGVNVYVGLTRYLAIEDVPDAQIKAAIRAAIAEWEDKYTPGLK